MTRADGGLLKEAMSQATPAPTLRLATERDAAEIQAIYAAYVRDTCISFELEPPSVE